MIWPIRIFKPSTVEDEHLSEMDSEKRKSHKWNSYILLICMLIIICLAFTTRFLKKQQTWADLNYSDVNVFPSMNLSIENGDTYGIHSEGPYYRLPAGKYTVRLTVETDGGGSVNLMCSNGADISPNRFTFSGEDSMPVLEFEILEAADDFQIQISFDSGTYMNVQDIRLYSPFYLDHVFSLTLILMTAFALIVLYQKGRLPKDGLRDYLILAAAVIVCSVPVLKDNIGELIDLEFHMARIENLADGMKSGHFPVRAGGFSFNGYGAITSVFYPDILLVPFALLRIFGASPTYVISLLCISCSALAAGLAYYAGRRMFANSQAGLIAAILYVCSAYRLNNLFIRGALGEGLAMSFYPLFILGLWEILYGDPSHWRTLTAGAFLIFMSHMLTTVMAALMAAGICILSIHRILRERRYVALVKAFVSTACLSAFFLVPMVTMFSEGINADAINIYRLQDKTIAPAQLFLQNRGLLFGIADPTIDTAAVEIGLPIVIGILVILLELFTTNIPEKVETERRRFVLVLLTGGLFFAFMTTTLFPWPHVSRITLFFNRIQFAWRFLGPSIALLVFGAGYAYSKYFEKSARNMPLLILFGSLLVILPMLSEQTRNNSFFRFGEGTSSNIIFNEYQIPGTDLHATTDRAVILTGNVQMDDYKKQGTRIDAVVTGSGTLTFPMFDFYGYTASADGNALPIARGINNRIQVEITDLQNAHLQVRYSTPLLWRCADVFSLITLMLLLFGRGRTIKRH